MYHTPSKVIELSIEKPKSTDKSIYFTN